MKNARRPKIPTKHRRLTKSELEAMLRRTMPDVNDKMELANLRANFAQYQSDAEIARTAEQLICDVLWKAKSVRGDAEWPAYAIQRIVLAAIKKSEE